LLARPARLDFIAVLGLRGWPTDYRGIEGLQGKRPIRFACGLEKRGTVKKHVSNKTQELKGRAKEAGGKLTGDRDLELSGKADQVQAHSKNAGAAVKKSARKARDTLAR
jgi:uncharacterized protein YjbJ (UPF0337 family)